LTTDLQCKYEHTVKIDLVFECSFVSLCLLRTLLCIYLEYPMSWKEVKRGCRQWPSRN